MILQFVVLFSVNDTQNMAQLSLEVHNCAVLDCGCSSTVCGGKWLKCYLDSLDDKGRMNVKEDPGVKRYSNLVMVKSFSH